MPLFRAALSLYLDSNDAKKVTYEYGTSGNVERVTDAANTRVTEIRYDLAGREMEREIRENGEQKYLHDLTYDNRGSLVRMGERVSGGEYVSQYEYDSDERLVKSQYGTDESLEVYRKLAATWDSCWNNVVGHIRTMYISIHWPFAITMLIPLSTIGCTIRLNQLMIRIVGIKPI